MYKTLTEMQEALDQLISDVASLKKREKPKVRCDPQGRLLEALEEGSTYYLGSGPAANVAWEDCAFDTGALAEGRCFISQAAAKAEVVRLKCLQRLRGMEGFSSYQMAVSEQWPILVGDVIPGGVCYFNDKNERDKAQAPVTPAERAAFLYREPRM